MALQLASSRCIPSLIGRHERAVFSLVRTSHSRFHNQKFCWKGSSPLSCLLSNQQSVALFSTEESSSSSSFSPVDWWRKRQETKEEEKYKKKIVDMTDKETWTIGDMKAELDDVVKSWKVKMPVISDNKETKMAKQMHKTLTGIVNVMGQDATGEMLEQMTRTEKLKASLEGETTVEDINIIIVQFQTMDLMHRILRKRKAEGKKIPETADAMQAIMQAEGTKVLSKSQKNRMKKQSMNMMKKAMQRR